jgi:uncharacterized protein (TIGR02391 family)
MASAPIFEPGVIEGVAHALGDTSSGLTGTEIGRLLAQYGLPDPGEMTKWRRIAASLSDHQAATKTGNGLVIVVKAAMRPVRWAGRETDFSDMVQNLNGVLAFAGLELHKDGEVHRRKTAVTHSDAAVVSRRIRDEIQRRGGHAEVYRYCAVELVADDCFGAVFEASKGLAERIRTMTDLDTDGHQLVQDAFEGSSPMVAFNSLRTDTERNEQRGIANILKGIFSAFRNPAAHEPRIVWHIREQDALDLLSMISLVHRRLDEAQVLRRSP